MRINWRRVLFWTGIALVIYWLASDPVGASGEVKTVIYGGLSLLKTAVNAFSTFLGGLFHK